MAPFNCLPVSLPKQGGTLTGGQTAFPASVVLQQGKPLAQPLSKRMTFLRNLIQRFAPELAVDLGTANTLILLKEHGKYSVVVDEPSVVAIHQVSGKFEAFGHEAREMLGRTPQGLLAIRPIQDGVIANFNLAEHLLRHLVTKAIGRNPSRRCSMVIAVPSDSTSVERRAVVDSAFRAKASHVHLVDQAMVAAIGAGLPVTRPFGNMIVDIGGGTTNIAVISLSGIVHSLTVRVGGNTMDSAIAEIIRKRHGLLIGDRTAEQIKWEVGSAAPLDEPLLIEVAGRCHLTGLPRTAAISDFDAREAVGESVATIIAGIRNTLELTPPELSADIGNNGLTLTGGGSLLRNLGKSVESETGIAAHIAKDPGRSVVNGIGDILSDRRLLDRIEVQY